MDMGYQNAVAKPRKSGGDGPLSSDFPTRHPRFWYQAKYRYGVTASEVLNTLELQGGGCGICGRSDRGLHIDHDHKTNKFRGVLCHECNRGLGYFGDSLEGLQRAMVYLVRSQ